jgi:hypothetical protein
MMGAKRAIRSKSTDVRCLTATYTFCGDQTSVWSLNDRSCTVQTRLTSKKCDCTKSKQIAHVSLCLSSRTSSGLKVRPTPPPSVILSPHITQDLLSWLLIWERFREPCTMSVVPRVCAWLALHRTYPVCRILTPCCPFSCINPSKNWAPTVKLSTKCRSQ